MEILQCSGVDISVVSVSPSVNVLRLSLKGPA